MSVVCSVFDSVKYLPPPGVRVGVNDTIAAAVVALTESTV